MTTKKNNTISQQTDSPKEDPPATVGKRILCILAHVDHGKTTVADCLLALAGVVRYSSVGKVRFMDSRIDEQQKGITMKTAAFSMRYDTPQCPYIFTLVDTPGHVDFSKEVLSAVKSCDGALIVVDVVEGVRAQTRESIQIALEQSLKIILVINKFDRLVLDLRKTALEAYEYICRLVESCNMVVSQVCQRNGFMEEYHLFHPEGNNVIICSGIDGWGVIPKDIAKISLSDGADAATKKFQQDAILRHLFDPDYYMDRDKRVKKGASRLNKSCLFLNLVIRPLYDIYYKLGIRMEKDQDIVAKIAKVLKISVTSEMHSNHPRTRISAILREFAPLGDAVVRASISVVPEARRLSDARIRKMIYDKQFFNDPRGMAVIDSMVLILRNSIEEFHEDDYPKNLRDPNAATKYPKAPCYAYISKIISVPRADILPDPKLRKKQIAPRPYVRRASPSSFSSMSEYLPTSPMDVTSPTRSIDWMDVSAGACSEDILNAPIAEDNIPSDYSGGANRSLRIDITPTEEVSPMSSFDPEKVIDFEADLGPGEPKPSTSGTKKVNITLSEWRPEHQDFTSTSKYGDESYVNTGLLDNEVSQTAELSPIPLPITAIDDLSSDLAQVSLSLDENALNVVQAATQTTPIKPKTVETQTEEEVTDDEAPVGINTTIAVIRVFFGRLKKGDKLTLLQSGYKPPLEEDDGVDQYNLHRTLDFKIKQIYILNGRDVIKTSEAGAGVICGIGFDHLPEVNGELLRSGTIVNCAHFYPIFDTPQLDPVLRVSVMPMEAKHMLLLGNALKWLKQCDSVVKVTTDENGEYVFLSSGDVHLSKIKLDLKNYMKNIPLNFSDPIVKIRETVLNPIAEDVASVYDALDKKSFKVELPEYQFFIKVFVCSLPDPLANLIEEFRDILKQVEGTYDWGYIRKRMAMLNGAEMDRPFQKPLYSSQMCNHVWMLKYQLRQAMESIIREDGREHVLPHCYTPFSDPDLACELWSVGHYTHTECSNILWNKLEDYSRNIFYSIDEQDDRGLIDSCIVKAFHETIKSGPICGEPITRCAFAVTDFGVASYDYIMACGVNISTIMTQITNACISAMKGAMLNQTVKLMEPVFESEISIASADQTGLVNKIVEKRHGKVNNDACMNFDETRYGIIATIPAINCTNFANEIRQATSGFADAFLTYHGYWMVEGDPLKKIVVIGDDDDEDVVEENRAFDLRNVVRRRKGLHVDDQVVASGEKQRTLSKKK